MDRCRCYLTAAAGKAKVLIQLAIAGRNLALPVLNAAPLRTPFGNSAFDNDHPRRAICDRLRLPRGSPAGVVRGGRLFGRSPDFLQPAEPFLDLSGEDIRKSLYLTTDASGDELCLRPDLTIPVARDYLASSSAGQPAGFCYLGPVFRYRGDRPSEFVQAGVESFGRKDRAAADAEMLALGLEATAAFGITDVEIRTGDVGLFAALIGALDLAPVWKRRLMKDFNRKISLAQDLKRMTLATSASRTDYHGVLAALAGSDRKAALALVSDLISIAGATNFSGRTNAEIADRFLEQSTMAGGALPKETRRRDRTLPVDCGRA